MKKSKFKGYARHVWLVDIMLEVIFDRTSKCCWAQEVSEKYPELRMEVLAIQGELGLSRWTARSAKTLEEAFESCKHHNSLLSIQELQQDNRGAAMLVETRCTCEDECVHPLLQKHDSHYLLPSAIVTKEGKRRYRILVTNENNLHELLTDLRSSGEAKIVSIKNLHSNGSRRLMIVSSVIEDLSPRQREVLSIAYRCGYFHIPRAVTIKGLGDKLGLHKTTVHEHLRKAEQTIMQHFAGFLG